MPGPAVRRIAVIGKTGSGKSTVARQLARLLAVPHVELDALHWEPDWREAPTAVMRARVARALAADAWVTDGNYSVVRDLIWTKAEMVVWLDYDLPVVFWHLATRTARRVLLREALWSGNRERFGLNLINRESLFWWALKSHRKHRREFPAALAEGQHQHLTVVRLRSRAATRRWLRGFAAVVPEASRRPAPTAGVRV